LQPYVLQNKRISDCFQNF
jgi:serine/threonine protein kinase